MHVTRRSVVAALAGSALWPFAARAQSNRIPTVGFIMPGTPDSDGKWVAAFAKRMSQLGWVDGKTVTLAYRGAAGQAERYAEFAAELARLNAAVIVTSVPGAVTAVKQAAPNMPVVHTAITTGSPFIASLAHPGGTVTGMSQMGPELGDKRLELLKQVVPRLRRVAILGLAGGTNTAAETAAVAAAARRLRIEVIALNVRQASDIAPAIAQVKGRVEALYVVLDPFISVNQVELNRLALEARLPTMHGVPEYVASGGLMSYGASFEELFGRSADYADKILRGAKPGDLPVGQPANFDLVINVKTAKALGLAMPASLLVTADELIE